jgi:hypothetical protein
MLNNPSPNSAGVVTTEEELNALLEALQEEATEKLTELDPETVTRRIEEEICFAEREEEPWMIQERRYSPRVKELRIARNNARLVADSLDDKPLTLQEKREAFHIALSRFVLMRSIQYTRLRLSKAAKEADCGAVYEQIEALFTEHRTSQALVVAGGYRDEMLRAHPNIPEAASYNLLRTIGNLKSLLADLHEVRVQEQESARNS